MQSNRVSPFPSAYVQKRSLQPIENPTTMNKTDKVKWSKVKGRFHYLSVASKGDKVLGFIFQQGPESLFNCNIGSSDSDPQFKFIGHKCNSRIAKDTVETAIANLNTVA